MSDKLVIMFNGQATVEYDRSKRLPGHQRQYLDKMDSDMDAGIDLAGDRIDSPDAIQRAKFVAMHLVQALMDEQDGMIAAGCAYLAIRLPDLKQVKVIQQDEDLVLDLIFNPAAENQVVVQFDAHSFNKQKH
jgi:hypothetical protein